MGMMGGIARAVGGPPSYSTVSSVKNPAIQAGITSLLSNYRGAANDENTSLSKYISDYMANQPAAAANTSSEVGAIGQFYNGSMANQLAQLRAQRSQAVNAAADVASQQAIAAQNRSRVAGQGSGSSYDARMTMANLTPIRVQAALDNANQERSDLGYVTGQQLSLAGKRNDLMAAQAAASSGLVPQQARMAALQQQGQQLGQITNLDQANNFYGLQAAPNVPADILDSFDTGILNAASIYGSMGSPGMSHGGVVHGPGTGTSDSIPVRLSKGEFVIPADVVHIPGMLPLLEKLRHLHQMHHIGKHQEKLKAHLDSMKPAKGKASGGMVGYAGGGMIGGGGGGGGGGGLAGEATYLAQRSVADINPQWMPATMVPTSGMAPGAGLKPRGTQPTGDNGFPQSPPNIPGSYPQSPYFKPSNYQDISPAWRDWANQTADYYNNPKSPGYVAPGTYE